MATTDTTAVDSELPSKSEDATPEVAVPVTKCPFNYSLVDVALRVLLLVVTLISVVVMVTSKQTELVPVPVPGFPGVRISVQAKFNHSPALVYFVAALSLTGLYSIITILVSVSVVVKPVYSKSFLLLFSFLDVVFVGIVASATGAAAAISFIGLKGNRHVGWTKICNIYDKFCRYTASSITLSLFAAILLVVLSMISTFTLYKKIRD